MSLEISNIVDQFRGVSDQIWKQDKKYKKILKSTRDHPANLFQVINLDWKLDDKYNWILSIILKEKNGNSKSIYEKLLDNERDIEYKMVNRSLNHLIRLDLVQESTAGYLKNLDKFIFYYGLTLNGLVYIIMNWSTFLVDMKEGNVLTYLLDNYPDNPITESFLYPYFDMDTLRNSPISLSFEILNYLREICEIIISHTRWQGPIEDSLIDGSLPIHVFSWPSPNEDNRSNYERYFERNSLLRDLLTRELGWKWINEAEFIPRFYDDMIQIRSKNLDRDTYIKIDREKKIVELIHGSKKYSSFFRLEIRKNNSCSVSGKTNLIGKEILEKGLRYQTKRKLLDLIYVIMIKYKGTDSDYYKFVSNDEKFKAVVEDLVKDLKPND
ncbi:MAG: hypothetical protein AB7V56_08100 [Candidatus Nitrosocosmicus sp.]